MLIVTHNTFCFCCNTISHLLISKRNGSKKYMMSTILAKKKDFPAETSSKENNKASFPFNVFSSKLLIQSAIGVSALGFIDAGYSGDWSRIGVISKETEDLLKTAAFLVVPLCISFIFFLSKKDEDY